MGFDVIGVEPRNKTGQYIRNNIWWWTRLWEFCCYITPELTDEDRDDGHHNSGHVIDSAKHKSLDSNLSKALAEKEKYADWIAITEESFSGKKHWAEHQDRIPGVQRPESAQSSVCKFPFCWRNVQAFYEFASKNSGFRIC